MFYIEVADTYPRRYELTDTPPEINIRARWQGRQFATTLAFVIHSKMYGSHKKPQPYVVRGVARDGRLLVQTLIATEHDPKDSWHEVETGDTVEGYRFKRKVLKPLTALIKLATTIAKERGRAEAREVKAADRAEKCGVCPVCFGDYVVTTAHLARDRQVTTKMVHHGYERPGHGYIVGDCHGVGFEPFELSCEGTKSWRNSLHGKLSFTNEAIRQLDIRDEIAVDIKIGREYDPTFRRYRDKIQKKVIKRGEEGFNSEIEKRHTELAMHVEMIERDIEMYTQKIDTWKPQQWPRK